jgi:predicted nucleic acid-binding protein
MPILSYLADINAVSDFLRGEKPVRDWFSNRRDEIGISTLSLAEIRRGIELKADGKLRRALEQKFRYVMDDYKGAIFVFDEASAMEWGRLMAEARHHPIPYEDSLIGAIARSVGLTVITRNIKHFPGCKTVDPWTGTEHSAWHPAS